MKNISKLVLLSLITFSLPTFAAPLAQRSCNPDDLQIGPGSNIATQCIWKANNDVSLQVTLHTINPVSTIGATCAFTPANPGKGKDTDAVVAVQGHKSAVVRNLTIKNNIINFEVVRHGTDANLNVIFYLNKTDNNYTPGDKLNCSFSDAGFSG